MSGKKTGVIKKAKRSEAKPVAAKKTAPGKREAARMDRYAKLSGVLARATPAQHSALLEDLRTGGRIVPPDIRLSPFEAGFVAAHLEAQLNPKRRRWPKIIPVQMF
jgi:hypothetical protein